MARIQTTSWLARKSMTLPNQKMPMPQRRKRSRIARFFNSTSRQTFFILPLLLFVAEALIQSSWPTLEPWGVPFLVWGYLQCRLSATYRNRLGGGGPGRNTPPDRIVVTGIYRYVRNPMYLGNIIFVGGLALTLNSWLTYAVLVVLCVWYDVRVREDERRLSELFGEAYEQYLTKTQRWIPYIY